MIKNFKSLFSPEQIAALFLNSKSRQNVKAESKYGSMLRESKKIRCFYGNLSKKYLQRVIEKSYYFPYQRNENIFKILESRLDVVLYRSGFFESIASAKQWILTSGVEINKKKITSPGTIVVPGDIISLKQNKKNFREAVKKKQPKWRFKASPFKMSLFTFFARNKRFLQKPVLSFTKKVSEIKAKWIEFNLYKSHTIFLSKQFWNWSLLKENSSTNSHRNDETDSKSYGMYKQAKKSDKKNNFFYGFLFTNYKLFLKKQFSLSNKNIKVKSKKKQNNPNYFQFSSINKIQKKNACFSKQKNQLFFKEQFFFASKKSKPLHLEISYKSLSIIFLFPPQRICFPYFINVSQICK